MENLVYLTYIFYNIVDMPTLTKAGKELLRLDNSPSFLFLHPFALPFPAHLAFLFPAP